MRSRPDPYLSTLLVSTFLMRCIRNVPSVMELTIITLMLKKSVCIVWDKSSKAAWVVFIAVERFLKHKSALKITKPLKALDAIDALVITDRVPAYKETRELLLI